MPRRRRRPEEHENHERWLVSYADFITLLFAFFVVMYSISSLNESKYKVLSDSLSGIFSQPERSLRPIPVGDQHPVGAAPPVVESNSQGASGQPAVDPLQQIAASVRSSFGDLIADGQLNLHASETWLEIELSSNLLFSSGDALPSNPAFGLLEKVAKILAPYKNPIQVQGYTDDRPISTALYPTNWELSAARAASIVRLLVGNGIAPQRLAVVGYGAYQPVTDNSSESNRARNRRVVLLISRNLNLFRPQSTLQNPSTGTQSATPPGEPAPGGASVKSSSPASAPAP
ncbi:flagellar motor protein MotD [Pseudomonas oryzihabitans]|uniref:flagellar motor protein MotD n=1 Tax=Pseudomonas oryzihabitans TaxID=47885 RepID=UPI00285AC243|nr:flagellar motor protein MotD [Pseudomonas psychrotolerans]MDR6680100.1 chemotaxis protein MotB [Pseudomonas psychrotolerans]